MPMPNCDICKEKAVGVVCSLIGVLSQAYCKKCLENCAEPKYLVDMEIELCGGYDKVADWVKDTVFVLHEGEYISVRKWKKG
jgi:hypothetical protein